MRLFVVLSILISAAVTSAMGQPPEMQEERLVEEVYLARDDGTGKPGQAATEFVVTDTPIHCVVRLTGSQPVTVKMDLVAANVPGVQHDRRVVSTTYTTKDLQNQVFFNGKPQGLWTAGAYRADIYIDGNLIRRVPFVIKGSSTAKPALNLQPRPPRRIVKPQVTTAKRL